MKILFYIFQLRFENTLKLNQNTKIVNLCHKIIDDIFKTLFDQCCIKFTRNIVFTSKYETVNKIIVRTHF